MISLDDLGRYCRWIFDHPERSDGMDLEIATQHVTWENLIQSFLKVNPEKKAIRVNIPIEEYFKGTGRKKDDPVTFAPDSEGPTIPPHKLGGKISTLGGHCGEIISSKGITNSWTRYCQIEYARLRNG